MSRSYKKAIIKDKSRNKKRTTSYWRPVRRTWNQLISTYKVKYDNAIVDLYYGEGSDELEIKIVEQNSIMLGTELPNSKEIINDCDYCDYIVNYEYNCGWFITNSVEENLPTKKIHQRK